MRLYFPKNTNSLPIDLLNQGVRFFVQDSPVSIHTKAAILTLQHL